MRTTNTRDILIGVAIFILIILLAVFLIRRGQNNNNAAISSPLPTPVSSLEQNLKNNFGITVPDSAIKANLVDVTGGNQMGLATLDKSNNQNSYTIIANLETPAYGYFYQAWLVNNTDTISLGKLGIAKAGWLINFNSSKDLSDHNKVWITLERSFDKTPEKHILEGSF